MNKKVTLTISEYTNAQNEKKKKRVNVGRIHQYEGGGEAIVLDAALCATIAAKAQAALIAGEDSIWLSIFEDDGQRTPQQQPAQQQQAYQQPAPVQQPTYQQPAPAQQGVQMPQQNQNGVTF